MIDLGYVQTMARYGAWQNESLSSAADGLSDAARDEDRGAFFGSISATLNHLLWGDRIWMSRFVGTPPPQRASIPESVQETTDWQDYRAARAQMDATIQQWATALDPAWLQGDLNWFSGAAQREVCKPKSMLVMHFFNHATHHRGQVHAMLTAAGASTGDTDLFFLPDADQN